MFTFIAGLVVGAVAGGAVTYFFPKFTGQAEAAASKAVDSVTAKK